MWGGFPLNWIRNIYLSHVLRHSRSFRFHLNRSISYRYRTIPSEFRRLNSKFKPIFEKSFFTWISLINPHCRCPEFLFSDPSSAQLSIRISYTADQTCYTHFDVLQASLFYACLRYSRIIHDIFFRRVLIFSVSCLVDACALANISARPLNIGNIDV